jgi:hypothetical protein
LNISMNDLHEERRRFEQYTREQNARLTRLRDLINEEKATARADLEKERAEIVAGATKNVQAELDEARQLLREQEKAQVRTNADQAAALAEMKRIREQLQEVPQLRKELQDARANAAAQAGVHQEVARKFQTERDAALADAGRVREQLQANAQETQKLRQEAASLHEEHTQQQARQAELNRRCTLFELAANEAAQLREEAERLRQENAQQKANALAFAGVRNELATTRAELDIFRQRDAGRARELEQLRAAVAQWKACEAQQGAIVAKAQELCRLISETRIPGIPG